MASTSTPMPPTQWVKLRQNRIPRGRASISVRMEEPVVVKPDTLSKKSVYVVGNAAAAIKGQCSHCGKMIHIRAAMTMPSRANMYLCLGR